VFNPLLRPRSRMTQSETMERTRLTLRLSLRSMCLCASAFSTSSTALLNTAISNGFDDPCACFCFSSIQFSQICGWLSRTADPSQLDLRMGQSCHFTRYQTKPVLDFSSAIIFSGRWYWPSSVSIEESDSISSWVSVSCMYAAAPAEWLVVVAILERTSG